MAGRLVLWSTDGRARAEPCHHSNQEAPAPKCQATGKLDSSAVGTAARASSTRVAGQGTQTCSHTSKLPAPVQRAQTQEHSNQEAPAPKCQATGKQKSSAVGTAARASSTRVAGQGTQTCSHTSKLPAPAQHAQTQVQQHMRAASFLRGQGSPNAQDARQLGKSEKWWWVMACSDVMLVSWASARWREACCQRQQGQQHGCAPCGCVTHISTAVCARRRICYAHALSPCSWTRLERDVELHRTHRSSP